MNSRTLRRPGEIGTATMVDAGCFAILYLLYWPIARILTRGAGLPESAYEGPVVSGRLLLHLVGLPPRDIGDWVIVCIWLVAVGGAVFTRKTLLGSWSGQEWSRGLRPVVVVTIGVVTWVFSTYDYNLYFNQGHTVDRLLLVLVGVLALVRPIFVVPLAALGLGLMGQFNHPLGGFFSSHVMLPFGVLMLFTAALVARALTVKLQAWHVLVGLLSLVAAGYLRSGVDKLWLDWVGLERVYSMLFATHASGWLAFLSADSVSALGRLLVALNPIMVGGTLALEIGMLFVFWNRPVAIALLLLATAMHLAILSMSGIFFFMWIAIDLSLVLILWRCRDDRHPLFSPRMFGASLVLVPLSVLWFQPAGLSWVDVPFSYSYRFEGTGESGRHYTLPPTAFAPYEYVFTLGGFEEYVDAPLLPIRWGAASPDVAAALEDATTAEEVLEIERRLGSSPFDASAADLDGRFGGEWGTNFAARSSKRVVPFPFRAPLQLNSSRPASTYDGGERLCVVEVRLIKSFFDGTRYAEISDEVVRSIPITSDGGCAPDRG